MITLTRFLFWFLLPSFLCEPTAPSIIFPLLLFPFPFFFSPSRTYSPLPLPLSPSSFLPPPFFSLTLPLSFLPFFTVLPCRLHHSLPLLLSFLSSPCRTSAPPLSPSRSWLWGRWLTRSAASSSSRRASRSRRWWRSWPARRMNATHGCSSSRKPCSPCEWDLSVCLFTGGKTQANMLIPEWFQGLLVSKQQTVSRINPELRVLWFNF